jgi:8-amino-7-oxononanoate synthase
MTPQLQNRIKAKLALCKINKNYRELKNSKNLDDFVSNDYLGFAKSTKLKSCLKNQLEKIDLGSTGSRLLSGNHKIITETEEKICNFFNSKSAAIYSSGYSLNIGLLACLSTEKDIIILDSNIHVSLKNSAKLSKAQVFYFRHNDSAHLKKKLQRLQKSCFGAIFVTIESTYSMDGDQANIEEIESICSYFQANLIIDEAHSVGISGTYGEGLSAHLKNKKSILARIVTFGKAFGTQGAALLSSTLLNTWIKNSCHSFIYTTAPSPLNILTISNAIDELQNNSNHLKNIKQKIIETNKIFKFNKWKTPIYPFLFSDPLKLEQVSQKLAENKFNVLPIRSPTVRHGQERLRICVHNFNSKEKITKLYSLLEEFKNDWKRPIC